MIPVLAGILAAAALLLMSMPFVLVRFASQTSEQPEEGNELIGPARADGPGAVDLGAEGHLGAGGTGRADGSTPDGPGADCDLDPAGISLVLQPIHAIE